ncbi:head-tail connector protein [Clostridium guangxiense]|uniref:head-tail connector protein n=1 Tax=Clostridium guangxiense TaxID=1662055 RepID=UPI001E343C97|nr:head-tail connector protein [Clostridium guangxiense]MCD2347189.1 head-tail connector protein [Clostridium guangxiense]
MALKIITPPVIEPITLDEAKQHLRIVGSDDDIILLSMIKQAREFCEDFQNKKYITQILELVLDSFPDDNYISFDSSSPVQNVESVKYYDTYGKELIFDSNNYIVDTDSFVNRIVLGYCKLWPTIVLQPINAVRIRFTAGFGDKAEAVPETVKWAMILHMKLLYDDYKPDERTKIEEARNSLLSMNRVIPV